MKTCKYSASCYYGNAFHKNQCAYKKNMEEYDLCPRLLINWENIIDEIFPVTTKKEMNNNA